MTAPDPLSLARRALEMAEKATPGPWTSDTVLPAGDDGAGTSWGESPWRIVNGPPQAIQDTMLSRRAFTHEPDAAFIAFSRTALPELARALIASQEEAEKLRAELTKCDAILAVCDPDAKRGLLAGEALVLRGIVRAAIGGPS